MYRECPKCHEPDLRVTATVTLYDMPLWADGYVWDEAKQSEEVDVEIYCRSCQAAFSWEDLDAAEDEPSPDAAPDSDPQQGGL